ncbi:phosphopantetheine-binding protein, partial [Kibdelosporangium lantanae]
REAAYRAPRNEREELLCQLFADVLGVSTVGIDDGFFELGGDSIASIQLSSRARRAGLKFTLREVFDHRTVAELATIARSTSDTKVVTDDGVGEVPLTPAMHWLKAQGGNVTRFTQRMTVPIPPNADTTAALQVLLDHHDALRMKLSPQWELSVQAVGAVRAEDCLNQDLDPFAGRMVEARHNGNELTLTIHHLAVDAVSWRILLPDLAAAFAGTKLEPVGTSFRRWAQQLVTLAGERTHELDHWREVLDTNDPLMGS